MVGPKLSCHLFINRVGAYGGGWKSGRRKKKASCWSAERYRRRGPSAGWGCVCLSRAEKFNKRGLHPQAAAGGKASSSVLPLHHSLPSPVGGGVTSLCFPMLDARWHMEGAALAVPAPDARERREQRPQRLALSCRSSRPLRLPPRTMRSSPSLPF